MSMNPIQNRRTGAPIPVDVGSSVGTATVILPSGYIFTLFYASSEHSFVHFHSSVIPILPHDLASDIQQFSESQYAKQYFSTHRTGFIFRRTVPVAQMMTWQKVRISAEMYMM